MNQDEQLNPTPEDEGGSPSPSESSEKKVDSTPISEEPAADASVAENPSPEVPKEALSNELDGGASPLEQAPVYRWTYADQVAHEAAVSTSKHRKGMLIYAAIMTGVFLVSFALLMAVLLTGNRGSGGSGIVLRPGITAEDDEAVAGVEQAKHSVVVIETKTATGGGVGTGIIMTEDGYIATNHHVVDKAVSIKVTFYNGTTMQAELIGSSEMDDLAVIKVRTSGLTAAKFADMENCFVGQTVYAIGTPSSADFGWSTTKGIISYKNREVKMYDEDGTLKKKLRLIQTDANVNPGNSGGPLINTNGEVIGVVSMRMADGFEGIGFAIPSDGAIEVLNAIIEHGNADNINSSLSHKRPMLGITGVYVMGGAYYLPNDTGVQLITEEELESYDKSKLLHPEVSGIYVMSFAAGMDAATKMSVGDIITAAQGDEIDSMDHLMDIINDYYAGDTITLTVYRNGRYIPVDIRLSEKPNS
jgi:serine protease Do